MYVPLLYPVPDVLQQHAKTTQIILQTLIRYLPFTALATLCSRLHLHLLPYTFNVRSIESRTL